MKTSFIPAPDGRGGFKPTNPLFEEVMESFIGQQAPGAIPNGRLVRKTNSHPNDRTLTGTKGIILGSIGGHKPQFIEGEIVNYGYMITWEDDKASAVFTTNLKIEEVD